MSVGWATTSPLPIAETFVGTLRFAHPTVSTSVRHSLSIYGTDACALALAKGRELRVRRGASLSDVGQKHHADESAPEVVARSKDVVATAAEELKDYERWLKDFVASEEQSRKRHARSLKREQARHRRRLKRERRARAGKRAALGVARAVRSASRSTVGAIVTAQRRSRDLTMAGAAWSAATSRAIAASTYEGLSLGSAWVSAKWRALTRASRETAATGWSWVSARTRVLALKSAKAGGAGATWVSARAHDARRVSVAAASAGSAWTKTRGTASRRQIAGIRAQVP